jgi:choline dehydrogenase-like flavoprotein
LRRVLPDRVCEWLARRAYGFFLQTEDASHPDNRVSAAANAPPALDYDPRRMPALVAEHAGLVTAFRRSLRRAGYLGFTQAIGLQGTAHAVGTLVAGSDPRSSVVDASGAVHGLCNLHVVDGSVLPRLGRMNPALSIYAWGLRVATLLSQAPPL